MKTVWKCFGAALPISVLLLLFFPCGCVQSGGPRDGFSGVDTVRRGGLLSLFLNLKDKNGPLLTMDVTTIDVLADDGSWQPVLSETVAIRAGEIKKGQKFLVRTALPPGTYSRLRFHLGAAYVVKADGKQCFLTPVQPSIEMTLRQPLVVHEGDSRSLFLTWDTRASLKNNVFLPFMIVAPVLKHMIADVAYVACPEINTVFMIRTDKNQVYDSMAVRDGPTYLFGSTNGNSGNDRLYALTRRKALVKVISPSANRVVAEYNLPMAAQATYMALSPDGAYGYVIDRQRGYVMQMDMVSGTIMKRKYLGYNPSYIIYLKKYHRLAVTQSLSQTVVLLDADTLDKVQDISTGSRPEGLLNWDETLLYIAESGSNSILIYDLEKGREVRRIPVEFNPSRLMSGKNSIYVTNYGSSSISVLKPGQMGAARIVSLAVRPRELVQVPKNNWIYVGSDQDDSIIVLDTNTSREVGRIELGAKPMGMVVLE